MNSQQRKELLDKADATVSLSNLSADQKKEYLSKSQELKDLIDLADKMIADIDRYLEWVASKRKKK